MRNVLLKVLGGLICLFCTSWEVMAEGEIKGRIIDSQTKEALVGATVSIEGTTVGVVADAEGYFELKVEKSGTIVLIFRSVGYLEVKKRVVIGDKKED